MSWVLVYWICYNLGEVDLTIDPCILLIICRPKTSRTNQKSEDSSFLKGFKCGFVFASLYCMYVCECLTIDHQMLISIKV